MAPALRRSSSSPAMLPARYHDCVQSSDSQHPIDTVLPPTSLTTKHDDQIVSRLMSHTGAFTGDIVELMLHDAFRDCVREIVGDIISGTIKTKSEILSPSDCKPDDTKANQISWLDGRSQSWDEVRTLWISVCRQQLDRMQNCQSHLVSPHTNILPPILERSGYWIISYCNRIECCRPVSCSGDIMSGDVMALMNVEYFPILQPCLEVQDIDSPRKVTNPICSPTLRRKRDQNEETDFIQKRVKV